MTSTYTVGQQWLIGPPKRPLLVTCVQVEGEYGFVGTVHDIEGNLLDSGTSVEHAGEFNPPGHPEDWMARDVCPICGPYEDCDPERHLEAEWRRETGSRDPQGPPIGWKPRAHFEP